MISSEHSVVTPIQLFTLGANHDFVDTLVRADARFLIVGGLAVKFYVPEREVDDLDLLIDPCESNASKVLAALSNPILRHSITIEQLTQPKKIQVPVKIHYYMDILTPGPDLDFTEAWNAACEARLGNTLVRVASIATLLQLLAASQEPKHVEDRQLLDALRG